MPAASCRAPRLRVGDAIPARWSRRQEPAGDAAYEFFRVEKMRFGKPTAAQKAAGENKDRSTIIYNDRITLTGIPEAAYRYMLGSRSAVEWIIDRYQVKTDKDSGIVNDPNDWSQRGQRPEVHHRPAGQDRHRQPGDDAACRRPTVLGHPSRPRRRRVKFTIDGQQVDLDAASVRRHLTGQSPEAIRTHWVEIDGGRWPVQAGARR